MSKNILGLIILLLMNACSGTQNIELPQGRIQEIPKYKNTYPTKMKKDDYVKNKKSYVLLEEGKKMLFQHKPKEAIERYFNIVINQQEQIGINDKILYAEALHHKGYAYIDLNMFKKAEEYIRKAIKVSDNNPVYISELGYIYQKQKNWRNAYDIFTKAEKIARRNPKQSLVLGRALRGKGFALIEMKQYKRAIEEYKRALKINKNDLKAKNELNYIVAMGYK